MNRRTFLKEAGLGIAALSLSGCAKVLKNSTKNNRPVNFVIIFTDDQGYADVGCFGAKDFKTPNLDRMAAEGMRFTDFYVSQAVCSASRSSLLTGCYANRIGIKGALNANSKIALNPDEQTIAEILKEKGYTTAIFGKWHLGCQKPFLPLQHGFDEYFGLPYSNDMWPVGYDGTPAYLAPEGSRARRKSGYPLLPLIEDNKTIGYIRTLDDQAKLTTLYTEHAIKFIEKHKDKPFFLYVPHSMPHVPLGVSKKFKGKSTQGMYGDVMMEIDWSVGQILKTLKKNGLDENTLVIFASDNGPWLNFGNHAGSALPLREGKGGMWEGGARVPCVMRWKGHITPSTICNRMAATIDLLPTIASIADAPLPEKKIDGINILPLLQGQKDANPRKHYFFYYHSELRAVRQGKWKLYFPHKYRSYRGCEPGKDGLPGRTIKRKAGLELYDLANDIGEKINVTDKYPQVVERLKALAQMAREDIGDSLTKQVGKNVRPPGRVD